MYPTYPPLLQFETRRRLAEELSLRPAAPAPRRRPRRAPLRRLLALVAAGSR